MRWNLRTNYKCCTSTTSKNELLYIKTIPVGCSKQRGYIESYTVRVERSLFPKNKCTLHEYTCRNTHKCSLEEYIYISGITRALNACL